MLEATRVESILSFVSGDYKAEMKEINDTRKRLPNAVINPVLEVVRYKTEKGNEKIKLVGSDDRYPITLNEDVMTLLSHPKVAAFISESLKNLS
ncbi:MAG TPA: hypothetical protein DG761_06105 [Gammaproteobacteria bacterium]|nr:hypothetical protein [Gammaproteobacteria bacterium]|tara:strand:+ start:344 stop:625 length:282 start_codon:yes stop_codon:yes gene_type:complete